MKLEIRKSFLYIVQNYWFAGHLTTLGFCKQEQYFLVCDTVQCVSKSLTFRRRFLLALLTDTARCRKYLLPEIYKVLPDDMASHARTHSYENLNSNLSSTI